MAEIKATIVFGADVRAALEKKINDAYEAEFQRHWEGDLDEIAIIDDWERNARNNRMTAERCGIKLKKVVRIVQKYQKAVEAANVVVSRLKRQEQEQEQEQEEKPARRRRWGHSKKK